MPMSPDWDQAPRTSAAARRAPASHVERLLRAGHIGHHRRGLVGEDVEGDVLHELRRQPGGGQHAERDHRLVGALQRCHPPPDLEDPLEGVVHEYRQQQGDQAEAVAELALVGPGAHVHRHHGAHFDALDGVALFDQVGAQRAGHGGEQQVVHRTAKGLAHRLDFVERHRFGPRHGLGAAGLALVAGLRVGGHDEQIGQFRRHPRALAAVVEDLAGMGQQFEVLQPGLGAEIDGADHALGHRLEDAVPEEVVGAVVGAAHLRRRSRPLGGVGLGIGEGEHDADQGDAVGDAVVDAHHQGRAAVVVVDQVEAPQRTVGVERRGQQVGRHVLQLRLVVACRQRHVVQVAVEVEVGVVLPPGAGGVVHHLLPEAAVAEQARLQGAPQAGIVHRPGEDHHADDHHQVGRPVHPQPGGVDRGDALALAHRGGGRKGGWNDSLIIPKDGAAVPFPSDGGEEWRT
jgi:hypothetical protein